MNAFIVKLIAVVIMLIDHCGAALSSMQGLESLRNGAFSGLYAANFIQMRLVGRIAFPIFVFFTAQGAAYTRSTKKYIMRLLIFALISEIPFRAFSSLYIFQTLDLTGFAANNVIFTMLFGVLACYFYKRFFIEEAAVKKIFNIAAVIVMILLCDPLGTDYGSMGALAILAAYAFREKKESDPDNKIIGSQSISAIVAVVVIFFAFYGFNQMGYFAALSLIPLLLYNGKPGPKTGKWFFYIFYPLHITIISLMLYGNLIGF